MQTFKYRLTDVDCANCAAKIEDQIKKTAGIKEVSYSFMNQKLQFMCDEKELVHVETQIRAILNKVEPSAILERLNPIMKAQTEECDCGHEHHDYEEHEHCDCGHDHSHEEKCDCGHEHHDHEEHEHCDCEHDYSHEDKCDCGHEHHDHEEKCDCGHEHSHEEKEGSGKIQYILEGLDCANCAAKIEHELKKMPELEEVTITFMNKTLRFNTRADLNQLEPKIQAVISKLEPDVQLMKKGNKNTKSEPEQKKMDKDLIKIIVGAIVFVIAMFFRDSGWLGFGLFMISYLILGLDILLRAVRNCLKGQVFDENFLMSIATVGAIAIQDYPEGVAVMLFYQVGEYFQRKAVEKSRKSITSLMDIRPDVAYVLKDGKPVACDPSDVNIGNIIVIKAGEKIPLDGIIIKGKTALDTSALTGESNPREVEENDPVLSGAINLSGYIEVKVTNTFANSTVSKILDLVENASSKKASAENFITKFARIYTPIVVLLACIIAFVLPFLIPGADFYDFFHRGLSFLVVSCPCALVISIPLSYFAGIGGLSKKGVLTKGSNYLDALNYVDTVVFDKTGTLTEGKFAVEKIISENPEECLRVAAIVEKNSNHPISRSIINAYQGNLEEIKFDEYEEIAGRGIRAVWDNQEVLAGNKRFMDEYQIDIEACTMTGSHIYVAKNKKALGVIVSKDQIKKGSSELINRLHQLDKKCVMLTGDNGDIAKEVGQQLKLDEIHYGLLPQGKVEKMEEILASNTGKVAFVGDGINDAPVLTIADIGFAMGGLGSDAAIEAADFVLMNDEPTGIAIAMEGAKKTRNIVLQNIVIALLIKIVVLLLVAGGMATMWEAVFADVGVSVLAICNAIRALK